MCVCVCVCAKILCSLLINERLNTMLKTAFYWKLLPAPNKLSLAKKTKTKYKKTKKKTK